MTAPATSDILPPMRIKTLTAPTMPEALRLLREQLGPEALILGTRKIPGANGQPTLEITAAIAEPEPTSKPSAPLPALPPATAAPALAGSTPLATALHQHGVSADIIARLNAALPGLQAAGFSDAEALDMLLTRIITFKPWTDLIPPGKAHVFIGPHGAGKTTLIAKLALQAYRNSGGQQPVGMLSLDTEKVAGFEPLAVAAESMGDIAHLIADTTTLRAAAASMGPRSMLLIDTPGLNPYTPSALTRLHQQVTGLGLPVTVHLVVPANLNPDDMAQLPIAAHRFGLASLVPTRLDATSRFGAVLSTASASGLPLGLASHGAPFTTPPLGLTATWMAQALAKLPTQPWELAP